MGKKRKLVLVAAAAVVVVAAAAVMSLVAFRGGGDTQAKPRNAGPTLTAANVRLIETALNSVSKQEQASALVPELRGGSWKASEVLPAGTKLTVNPATFRPADRFGYVVTASVGSTKRLLHLKQLDGRWLVAWTERLQAAKHTALSSPDGQMAVQPVSYTRPTALDSKVTCETGFGTKVPVLLVHGFNSNPRMWSEGNESSMINGLEGIEGIKVVKPFNYSDTHLKWVTHPGIGRKLAETIDCLAGASLASGGRGKVIVVAHSMGGLATRYAANQAVDTRPVADQLGLVITLGTPHQGSPLATLFGGGWRWYCGLLVSEDKVDECERSEAITAMQEGSLELAMLPEFPPGVAVRAIAGDVTLTAQLINALIKEPTNSDLVVPVSSATAEYTTDTGPGDGKFVFECRAHVRVTVFMDAMVDTDLNGASCSHNQMVQTFMFQEAVRNGIKAYLDATAPTATHNFYGLVLEMDESWEIVHEGKRLTTVRDRSKCAQADGVTACAGFRVYNYDPAVSVTGPHYYTCGNDAGVEEVRVGGKPATYQELTMYCGEHGTPKTGQFQAYTETWAVDGADLLIHTMNLQGEPRIELKEVLANATWQQN